MFKNGWVSIKKNSLIWQNLQGIFTWKNHLHFWSFYRCKQLSTYSNVLRSHLKVDYICLVYHSNFTLRFPQLLLNRINFHEKLINSELSKLSELILFLDLQLLQLIDLKFSRIVQLLFQLLENICEAFLYFIIGFHCFALQLLRTLKTSLPLQIDKLQNLPLEQLSFGPHSLNQFHFHIV